MHAQEIPVRDLAADARKIEAGSGKKVEGWGRKGMLFWLKKVAGSEATPHIKKQRAPEDLVCLEKSWNAIEKGETGGVRSVYHNAVLLK